MAEGVLGKIAAAKREELARRFDGVSLAALRSQALPTERSLTSAIAKDGARFILEIKKASPSAGAIRPGGDPAALARGFAGVADALSVLCDASFFGGSLEDLATARGEFDGPILAKDFLIDLRQVAEARIAGADAILVMLSLLGDEEARAMIAEAKRFGMEALVEVHDEAEMRRALTLGCPLIGINNRDLRDLSIDLSTTERLAPLAPDRILVSESGIGSRADVDRLSSRVDGFLIGSALMHAPVPAQTARELIVGRVKLCGLTTQEDLQASPCASFAGFVFVSSSPRVLTEGQAAPLVEQARSMQMGTVGVFQNAPIRDVIRIARHTQVDAVQLHGSEDADYVRTLRRNLPEQVEIWTAVSVGRDALDGRGGDRLLFDNGNGGSGLSFDWGMVRRHPEMSRAIVAGGLGPHNARSAQALSAYAIDVGSAVDLSPGRKSPEKIAALFEALRPVSRERLRACA